MARPAAPPRQVACPGDRPRWYINAPHPWIRRQWQRPGRRARYRHSASPVRPTRLDKIKNLSNQICGVVVVYYPLASLRRNMASIGHEPKHGTAKPRPCLFREFPGDRLPSRNGGKTCSRCPLLHPTDEGHPASRDGLSLLGYEARFLSKPNRSIPLITHSGISRQWSTKADAM